MNQHQVKQKITVVTSALCLTGSDTAPTSQMKSEETFILFLLNIKPLCSFVLLSNSAGMVHWTGYSFCFRINQENDFVTRYPVSCCLTNIAELKSHFAEPTREKSQRKNELRYKMIFKFALDEGKWGFFSIIVLISDKIPTGKYKCIRCSWFSAWSLAEQSF